MSATDAPRPASDAAVTAPLIPPPMISVSKVPPRISSQVCFAQRHQLPVNRMSSTASQLAITTTATTLPSPTTIGVTYVAHFGTPW